MLPLEAWEKSFTIYITPSNDEVRFLVIHIQGSLSPLLTNLVHILHIYEIIKKHPMRVIEKNYANLFEQFRRFRFRAPRHIRVQ